MIEEIKVRLKSSGLEAVHVQAAIIGFSTLILGLAIDYIKGEGGWWAVAISVGLCMYIAAIVAVAVYAFIREVSIRHLVGQLDVALARARLGQPAWLYSHDEVDAIEKGLTKGTVIILSPDLRNDSGDVKYLTTVLDNLRQGIAYHYVLPDNLPQLETRLAELKQELRTWTDLVMFSQLDAKVFHGLANRHVAVYLESAKERKVYIELPAGTGGWWMQMDQSDADHFIGRLNQVLLQPDPSASRIELEQELKPSKKIRHKATH